MQPRVIEGTEIDPAVVKVMKAIRQIESGGDYNAVGDAGDARGAFQYNEKTGPGWKNIARQYLGDENAPMDSSNQNKATYMRIKEWKDKDFQPEEIAALWNGASKGPNGRYVCNNPDYCKKFIETLTQRQQAAPIGATQFQTTVPRETQPEGGVLSQLGTPKAQAIEPPSKIDTRLAQGSEALGKLASGVATGDKSDIASGVLQTGGALAGGALDLVDAGLNAATFGAYDATMDFIGKKVIAPVFKGVGGDKIMSQWQEFATQHPEAAKNIGAFGNIISVLPVFKVARQSITAGKDVLTAGVARTGFIKTAEEAAKAELRQSAAAAPSKAKDLLSSRVLKGKTVDPVDTIVDGDYLPDVIEDANGIPRYNSGGSIKKLDSELELDEELLQRTLESVSLPGLKGYVPISALRAEADSIIKRAFVDRGQVDVALRKASKIMDDFEKYKGDLVPLTELNNMKRGIREAVNFNSPKLGADVRYQLGQLFMETIEDVAEKNGIKEVSKINRAMAEKIRAKEALEFLNERSVTERPGFRTMLGRKSGDVGTIAGESVGQAFGIPGVGAAIGRGISNRAISGSGKSVVGKLRSRRNRKPTSRVTKAATVGVLGANANQEPASQ